MKTLLFFLSLLVLQVLSQIRVDENGKQTVNIMDNPMIQWMHKNLKGNKFFEVASQDFSFAIDTTGQIRVIALNDIPQSHLLMKSNIHAENVISAVNIRKLIPNLPKLDDVNTILVFMLYEMHRCDNAGTLYRAYMDDLKMRYSNFKGGMGRKIASLQFSVLREMIEKRRKDVKKRFNEVNTDEIRSIFDLKCDEKKDFLNLPDFRWVYQMFYAKKVNPTVNKLFPFLDLFVDIGATSRQSVNVNVAGDHMKTGMVVTRKIKRGETLYHNNVLSNYDLFMEHGTCRDQNENSMYLYQVQIHLKRIYFQMDPNPKREEFLKRLKVWDLEKIMMANATTPYELDPKLLNFLRICAVHKNEFKPVDKNLHLLQTGNQKQGLHRQNELIMLQLLEKLFTAIMDEYDTTLEQDLELLKTDKSCQIIIRKEEKNVLKSVIASIQKTKLKQ